MTATEVRPEVSPPAESALCRVCGETVNPRQTHCPRCGNSTKTPLPNPLDSTWVDAACHDPQFYKIGGLSAVAGAGWELADVL